MRRHQIFVSFHMEIHAQWTRPAQLKDSSDQMKIFIILKPRKTNSTKNWTKSQSPEGKYSNQNLPLLRLSKTKQSLIATKGNQFWLNL